MKTLSESEFLAFVKNGKVVTINGGGVSVVRAEDGAYVKIFRPPSRLSSDFFSPRPLRFEKAVRGLEALNIPTVRDMEMYWVPCMKRHLTRYQPLPGKELRDVLSEAHDPKQLIARWIVFLNGLHEKGVYFRGINFSNVLLGADGDFGLIDVGSVVLYPDSLSIGLRARNLKHPLAYSTDKDQLVDYGIERFVTDYLKAAKLEQKPKSRFLNGLKKQHALFHEVGANV